MVHCPSSASDPGEPAAHAVSNMEITSCRTMADPDAVADPIGSGSDQLAFLGAGGTGLTATFARLVLVSVLFTFFFAVETGLQRHACKLRQILGVLISEILQRAAQRKHL